MRNETKAPKQKSSERSKSEKLEAESKHTACDQNDFSFQIWNVLLGIESDSSSNLCWKPLVEQNVEAKPRFVIVGNHHIQHIDEFSKFA